MLLAGWVHLGDPGVPVGKHGAGSAAAGACGDVFGKGARLPDVFRCEPDVAPIDHGSAVVTPARSRRVGGVEDCGTTEAVGRTNSLSRRLHRSYAAGVDRCKRGTREEVPAHEREGHHTVSVRSYGNGRIDDVVLADSEVTAVDQLGAARG